jgi:hypothetical protein
VVTRGGSVGSTHSWREAGKGRRSVGGTVMLGDWGDAASHWLEGEAAQPEGEAERGRGGDAAHGWKGRKRIY